MQHNNNNLFELLNLLHLELGLRERLLRICLSVSRFENRFTVNGVKYTRGYQTTQYTRMRVATTNYLMSLMFAATYIENMQRTRLLLKMDWSDQSCSSYIFLSIKNSRECPRTILAVVSLALAVFTPTRGPRMQLTRLDCTLFKYYFYHKATKCAHFNNGALPNPSRITTLQFDETENRTERLIPHLSLHTFELLCSQTFYLSKLSIKNWN